MIRKIAILLGVYFFIGWSGYIWASEHVSRENKSFNFGSVTLGSEVKHTFIIPNKNNNLLRIKNISPSCDCVHILYYPIEIPPHEQGQLRIRFIPSQLGEVAYKIELKTENPSEVLLYYELKGIVKAGISPESELPQQVKIPYELLTRKLKKRNPTLSVTVESVLKKLQEGEEIILVDIRKRSSFEKFWIPGSLNIPLFSVKTKKLFKLKSLILINEGYNYTHLEKECQALRAAGFQASILDGGVYKWKQKDGPLEGDIFAQKELNKIPPEIFWLEKNYRNWIFIDISRSEERQSDYLIPQKIHIPFVDEPEQFISKLRAIIDNCADNPYTSVLIFNKNGQYNEKIEKFIQKIQNEDVFYLKSGFEGYRAFLEQQASIWQGRDKTKKRIKTGRKCASCP